MQHGVKRVALSDHARKTKIEKDRIKIANYRALTKQVLESKSKREFSFATLEDTTKLLNVNPEFNAAWNFRRNILLRLFENSEISPKEALSGDLAMSMEMMKRFPKCYWIWNHRRWCLEELQKTDDASWERELAIVSKLLQMDSRNFHGWHYRRYVVRNMEQLLTKHSNEAVMDTLRLCMSEFDYTTAVINKSTSNFSAWHNRTKLIPQIFQLVAKLNDSSKIEQCKASLFKSSEAVLRHELDLVKTGMYMDADDTSVWLYMQWLFTSKEFVGRVLEPAYSSLLQRQLNDVEELNALEREDSTTNSDNAWCLKSIIFLRALANKKAGVSLVDDEITKYLNLLVLLDPLRKGHYLEQTNGTAPIIE